MRAVWKIKVFFCNWQEQVWPAYGRPNLFFSLKEFLKIISEADKAQHQFENELTRSFRISYNNIGRVESW